MRPVVRRLSAVCVPLLLVPVLLSSACKGSDKKDPVLSLSSEEALTQGKELLAKEKYYRARRYLTHAFEIAPNTALGREALLLAADTYYLQGGEANYVQAEAKYRDYLNRFPTSEFAAYVQFQLGNCLAKRTKKADRDQTSTEKALAAYEEVLRLYPTSEFAAQARDEIRVVRNRLAEHEFAVGRFYLSYGISIAAVNRLEGLLESYPDFDERDKVFFFLGKAYAELGSPIKALENFGRLRQEFPDSRYANKIPEVKIPKKAPAAQPEPKTEAAPEDEQEGQEGDSP
jgi:outer membrane protein assembly factor BamD